MVNKIFLIFLLFFVLHACSKAPVDYQSQGIIQGLDLTECACCGGYVIEIDNSTIPYRFEELPKKSKIDLETANFPLNVQLNWSIDRACGGINYLNIEQIEEM